MSRRTLFASALRVSVALAAALAGADGALAVEKASEQVSSFHGSFSQAVPIEVPAFRGLEPQIALSYSSEGRNGFVGVGWSLNGFPTIERANAGRGTPTFGASDIYLLNGEELVPCLSGSVSPSCTTGGTHSTKLESYTKIRFIPTPDNTFTIWMKDGTRSVLTPILSVPPGPYISGGVIRWGLSAAIDTSGNRVDYSWQCDADECYPGTVTYGRCPAKR